MKFRKNFFLEKELHPPEELKAESVLNPETPSHRRVPADRQTRIFRRTAAGLSRRSSSRDFHNRGFPCTCHTPPARLRRLRRFSAEQRKSPG